MATKTRTRRRESNKAQVVDDVELDLVIRLEGVSLKDEDDTQPAPVQRYIPQRKAQASLVPMPLPSSVRLFNRCLKALETSSSHDTSFMFLDTEGKVYVNDIAAVSLDGEVVHSAKISSDPFFLRSDPKGSIPIGQFWTDLSSKLASKDSVCYVCVHNAVSHDLPLLTAVSAIPSRFVFVDTLLFFWELFGAWSTERAAIPSCTMASLCKNILGEPFSEKNGAHTALADALALRRVVITTLRLLCSKSGEWARVRNPDGFVSVAHMLALIKYCALRVPVAVIARDDVRPLSFTKVDIDPHAIVYVSARKTSESRQPVMHALQTCKKIPSRTRLLSFAEATRTRHRKCEVCFTRTGEQ